MAGFYISSSSACKGFCKSEEIKSDLKDLSRRRRRSRIILLW
uniref:Uncharacterized protein n=1 Tax=Fusarium oxysporum (strain Fo5176) TaxID=660025 RepID=A0A0D2XEW2_FUSOF